MTKPPSLIDLRRLRDGAKALEVSSEEPTTSAEIREQIEAVDAGIGALQSLDSLDADGNERAEHDLFELWKRLKALKRRLLILEGNEN